MIATRSHATMGLVLLVCACAVRADEYEFDDDDAAGPPIAESTTAPSSVFDLSRAAFAQQAVLALFSRGEFDKAARLLERALKRNPRDFATNYNLACALARQGKSDQALERLQKAVEFGFRNVRQIEADDD